MMRAQRPPSRGCCACTGIVFTYRIVRQRHFNSPLPYPDLILHDIVMPTMGGYEAARRLRAIPALTRTLLIACSGSINEEKARQPGFNGWLLNPSAMVTCRR